MGKSPIFHPSGAKEDGQDISRFPGSPGGRVHLVVVAQSHPKPKGQSVAGEDDHGGVAQAEAYPGGFCLCVFWETTDKPLQTYRCLRGKGWESTSGHQTSLAGKSPS